MYGGRGVYKLHKIRVEVNFMRMSFFNSLLGVKDEFVGEVLNHIMMVLNSFYFRHVSGNNSPAKEVADITTFEVAGQAVEGEGNHVPFGSVDVEGLEATSVRESKGRLQKLN